MSSPATPSLRIRRALATDAERLTEIALASKRHWSYPEAWIEVWRDGLTFTPDFVVGNQVYVAVDGDDTPIACYALVGDGEEIQLEHVWVEPTAIGNGLGKQLFVHAVHVARSGGATALRIDSDPHAEGFYTKLGAVRVGAKRADVCGVRRELPQLRYALPP